ncbi:MAG: LytTR family DNA-binding domain-containing protein [Capnocytophaga sp.]|nr:LytTR family DNA-binding domain-containing protein [Capnocytophaga sp.]
MNLSCLVVDDEPMALNLIESYVLKTPFLSLKGKFSNAIDVLQFFHNTSETIDLVFLDIQMPELTGLDLSRKIPTTTKIVFTTAFDQYALEGYKVNSIGYLLKPFSYSEFLEAAEKAQKISSPTSVENTQSADYMFVKSDYKQLKIKYDDIIYIEGLKDYVKIYLTTQSAPVLTLLTLKKLTEQLPSDKFMRVHRSFIVALNKVQEVERNQIIFGKQRITIADQHREAFDEFLKHNSL